MVEIITPKRNPLNNEKMKTNEFSKYNAKSGRSVIMRKWSENEILLGIIGKNGKIVRQCSRVCDEEALKTFEIMKNIAELPEKEFSKVKKL